MLFANSPREGFIRIFEYLAVAEPVSSASDLGWCNVPVNVATGMAISPPGLRDRLGGRQRALSQSCRMQSDARTPLKVLSFGVLSCPFLIRQAAWAYSLAHGSSIVIM